MSPGQSRELTPENSTFAGFTSPVPTGGVNSIQVTAKDVSGATWGIWLAAPRDQQLAATRYSNAVALQSQSPERPGITFWNPAIAGCAQATGEFTIFEARFGGPSPGGVGFAVERFRATFEQRCVFNGQLLSAVKGELNLPQGLPR